MNLARHRTLWDLTRGQRLRYGAAIFALWLAIVFLYGVPAVTQGAIDGLVDPDAAPDGVFGALARWFARQPSVGRALALAAAAVVALTLVSGVFQYLRGRWAAVASESVVRGLRDRLYAHLERLPCSYHDRADTGDLVQRCTSDVETVRVFLSGQVVEIGRAALLFASVVPILLWMHAPLAAVALALIPLILAFAVVFFRRVKALFTEVDEAEGRLTSVLQENLTGVRVVRAFAREDHECCKFARRNGDFRDETFRLIRLLGLYWALSDFLCLTQIFGLTLVGAHWTAAGEISLGTFFAFLSYESLLIWPLRQLGRVLVDSGKAVVALGRLREILEEPEEPADGAEVPELSGGIVVERLSFAFDPAQPVLRDVSFRVAPGETVAFLGPPGSGKSALMQLLLRLYEYREGSIRLDGLELSSLRRGDVRMQVGAVLQEPFLYSRTVRANLRLGHEAARDDELVAAAATAVVHDAIEGLSDGYETVIGERGVTLSGGQRQRLALARALLKDPPILILDDAFSAVDTRTESDILDGLRSRRGRRTTLVIAHRLSSVAHADRILVLHEGRIVQSGTHAELSREEGPYRELWRIQGALEDEIEEAATTAAAGGGTT